MTLFSVKPLQSPKASLNKPVVALTGASGFLGTALAGALQKKLCSISMRKPEWKQQLREKQPTTVIHLAGLSSDRGAKKEIYKVNVQQTGILGETAARNGVRRFIFLSSIQALAEKNSLGGSLKADTQPTPCGLYGKSKLSAEVLLRRICEETGMELVILRAPLVYGPGAKANFLNLLRLVESGIPLPLAALDHNRRSFAAVSNLVDLVVRCIDHPAAANQIFHVSDDDDISTAELLRRIGKALDKSFRNLPIPASALKAGLHLAGKGAWVDKLFGNLQVNIDHTKQTLGWKPVVKMEEELERTALWWKTRNEKRDEN